MKLGHTEIFVRDSLRARDFYVKVLGFEEVEIQGGAYVWLQKDGRSFLLRPGRKVGAAASYSEAPVAQVLYTDNLPETMRTLAQRGLMFKGMDGSEHCPTFCDLDGNWFQLVNPDEH